MQFGLPYLHSHNPRIGQVISGNPLVYAQSAAYELARQHEAVALQVQATLFHQLRWQMTAYIPEVVRSVVAKLIKNAGNTASYGVDIGLQGVVLVAHAMQVEPEYTLHSLAQITLADHPGNHVHMHDTHEISQITRMTLWHS